MRLSGQQIRLRIILFLLGAALLLVLFGLFDPHRSWRPWHSLFGPEEDGSWAAISIDGHPVLAEEYRIGISDGKVSGGRDGCNDWGYADEAPDRNGERMIVSTLIACPEEDPVRQAYWALRSDPVIELRQNGSLRLVSRGHEGIFRRCRWETERLSGNGFYSERTVCLFE